MITWGVTALNVAAHWTQNTAQWTRHSCTVCTHNIVYAAQLHSVRMCKAVSHWRGRLPLPNPLTPPKTLKARQSQKDQKPKDIAAAHLTPGSKHFPDQNPQRRGSETQQKHQQHIFSAKEEIVTRPPPRRGQSFICIVLKPGSQRPTKEKFRCQEIRLIRSSKLVDEPDWSTVYVHLQLYQELFRFHVFPCFKSLRPSSSSSSPSSAANADD